MPEFDVNQWLEENGYDTGEDASSTLGDYWGNSDYNIDGLLTVDQMLQADSADPLAQSMYQWTLENPEYTGEEFAEEMFNVMWASASQSAQTEFVNTWNNWAFDHPDADTISIFDGDISGAAAQWASMYGSEFGQDAFFDPSINDINANMQTGMSDLIAEYNAEFGLNAYQTLLDTMDLEEADFASRSEDITQSMLEQLEGLDIQAGSAKEQYSLLSKKDLSAQAARGLSKKRKGLVSNNLDLKKLRLQLEGMSIGRNAAIELEEQNQDLLNTEWSNLLSSTFSQWDTESDLAFSDLLLDLDALVDTYNQAIIGASEEESAMLYDQLSGILQSGGITPPSTGTGWDDNDLNDGMCVTTDGNIGILCGMDTGSPGVCVMNIDQCNASEEEDDEEYYFEEEEGTIVDDGTSYPTEEPCWDGSSPDADGNCPPFVDCSDPVNQGHPDCIEYNPNPGNQEEDFNDIPLDENQEEGFWVPDEFEQGDWS
ncbi:MAG: hypothetical protein Unbinned4409contig1002_28 [Prokaryotic dsDNA virus sp.]|nr:MAG: hypothetical protein Unbinned4409contig1002_28 [Prokaryotic dsDNA virus sp.]|tara:strand:+ start:22587 stop:24038 length:1452 start_codon:yes stop_codon:yes gene_type:complete